MFFGEPFGEHTHTHTGLRRENLLFKRIECLLSKCGHLSGAGLLTDVMRTDLNLRNDSLHN